MAGFDGRVLDKVVESGAPPTPVEFHIVLVHEAEVHLYHRGRHVKELVTMSDFYGEMTCVEGAIEEARILSRYYRIDRNSDLIVVVFHKVYIEKRRPTGRETFWGQPEYYSVSFGNRKLALSRAIWSSRTHLRENQ